MDEGVVCVGGENTLTDTDARQVLDSVKIEGKAQHKNVSIQVIQG